MLSRCLLLTEVMYCFSGISGGGVSGVKTVKPVLVATSIKHTICVKHACSQFPKKESTLKGTSPVSSKHILFIP